MERLQFMESLLQQNEEFFVRMFKDEEFMSEVIRLLLPEVYRKLRKK